MRAIVSSTGRLASASGISVAETSLLGGANLLSAWLKWTWAPIVDVTLLMTVTRLPLAGGF